jgi:hypothetical protein
MKAFRNESNGLDLADGRALNTPWFSWLNQFEQDQRKEIRSSVNYRRVVPGRSGDQGHNDEGGLMKKLLIGTALLFTALPFTFDGVTPTVSKAHAIIGRPGTPLSFAGVHRRAVRRTFGVGANLGYRGFYHRNFGPYAYNRFGYGYRPVARAALYGATAYGAGWGGGWGGWGWNRPLYSAAGGWGGGWGGWGWNRPLYSAAVGWGGWGWNRPWRRWW